MWSKQWESLAQYVAASTKGVAKESYRKCAAQSRQGCRGSEWHHKRRGHAATVEGKRAAPSTRRHVAAAPITCGAHADARATACHTAIYVLREPTPEIAVAKRPPGDLIRFESPRSPTLMLRSRDRKILPTWNRGDTCHQRKELQVDLKARPAWNVRTGATTLEDPHGCARRPAHYCGKTHTLALQEHIAHNSLSGTCGQLL